MAQAYFGDWYFKAVLNKQRFILATNYELCVLTALRYASGNARTAHHVGPILLHRDCNFYLHNRHRTSRNRLFK
jgi:hypothetical protein